MAVLLAALTALTAAVTLIPFLPVAHGIVRVCDFPRLQTTALAALTLLAVLAFMGIEGPGLWLTIALALVIAVQGVNIAQFTPLWRKQSVAAGPETPSDAKISILASNVKISNRDYARTIEIVREADPDIAILIEVDEAWCEGVRVLKETYPYAVERCLDTGYGMALYSRLELRDVAVRDLLTKDVPSITATVILRDGRAIRLYAIHPEPPVPYCDTVGRDAEIALVAELVRDDPLPAIVTGDLNDVAWSRTTRRFQRIARMLDPRVGRGFYNSYDARYPLIRWPLDHLFHDPAFRLVHFRRLPFSGSDHFPMFFELALGTYEAAHSMPNQADEEDEAEAEELIEDAIERGPDHEAIGADWEKPAPAEEKA